MGVSIEMRLRLLTICQESLTKFSIKGFNFGLDSIEAPQNSIKYSPFKFHFRISVFQAEIRSLMDIMLRIVILFITIC